MIGAAAGQAACTARSYHVRNRLPAMTDGNAPTSPQGKPRMAITPDVVSGEVRDFVRAHERRRRMFPRAILVGLLAGLVAVAFRNTIDVIDRLRGSLIAFAHQQPGWGILLPIAFSAIGAGAGVALVQRFAPETAGSGVPHLKAVLHRLRGMAWRRVLAIKFVGGALSIGSGMALGREGPTVQMGGAIGQMVSQWFKGTARERQTLIAAGAGAGLAAAFNAPLAGVIFVLEEVQRDFTASVFTATFLAAVVADVVARVLTGQLPVFHVAIHPVPPLGSLPFFLIVGCMTGVLGVAFNRALLGSVRLFERASGWPLGLVGALVGGGIGLVAWFLPDAVGGGGPLVEHTLASQIGIGALLAFFVLRFALTIISYGTGAAGGIFAPLLVLGAQIGMAIGLIGERFLPASTPEPAMLAVVGMASLFTAIVRAPLTGIVLIVEMTGNYALMLPLLVGCFCAYGVADLLGDRPIYEALLEQKLIRSQDVPNLEGTLLMELSVQPGSPFENRRVGDLGLPVGCLIITVRRGMHDDVATRDSLLKAGDRITAVVAPQAAEASALLRAGVEARAG